MLNVLAGETGLFGGLAQCPLLNAAEVGMKSCVMRGYVLGWFSLASSRL